MRSIGEYWARGAIAPNREIRAVRYKFVHGPVDRTNFMTWRRSGERVNLGAGGQTSGVEGLPREVGDGAGTWRKSQRECWPASSADVVYASLRPGTNSNRGNSRPPRCEPSV